MFNLFPLSLDAARTSLLSEPSLTDTQRRWLLSLEPRIHKREQNYLDQGGDHYLKVGLSAMDCIQDARIEAKLPPPSAILDFPCGFGRVLRFLKVVFPEAAITGAEIEPAARKFCRKIFNIEVVKSKQHFSSLKLRTSFDLIWCGSLITHLDETRAQDLLNFFCQHLRSNGQCIFTTHGKHVAALLESGHLSYSLTQPAIEGLLAHYHETGFGFTNYEPERHGYGISLTSDDKVRSLANRAGDWSCDLFIPKGWDNHQDVYAYTKRR